MATQEDYRAILMFTEGSAPLAIAKYKNQGHKKKLFKGEFFTTVARYPDDPYFYYVDEGQIMVMFETESGQSVPVAWRNEGNAFSAEYNRIATIDRYQTRCLATKNTVLFSFTQQQLLELFAEDPDVFYDFVRSTHMHFGQMGHRLSVAANPSSTKRLVMWLKKLCAVHPANEDGTYTIPCTMTLKQIADYLFVHITTCTKLISALEDDGVIRRTRSEITVLDPQKLDYYGLDDTKLEY